MCLRKKTELEGVEGRRGLNCCLQTRAKIREREDSAGAGNVAQW